MVVGVVVVGVVVVVISKPKLAVALLAVPMPSSTISCRLFSDPRNTVNGTLMLLPFAVILTVPVVTVAGIFR